MTISTISVGTSIAPSAIETWCSHYLNRRPRKKMPTAHISYDLGLNIMRNFLAFAGKNSVEDVQAFTAQWAPKPRWVRTESVNIPEEFVGEAASHIQAQLGPSGIHAVGGKTWWQWRQDDNPLKAEWVEMRKDYDLRKRNETKCQRSVLYIHGGAYYFASIDSHRYQMQRHARKLQARLLAPDYRLAPQFPFPCGLLDCLATYKYLLTLQAPETIIFMGDSAGGGMALSLLAILRDQGLPLPAGAVLLSPWVDLTHSFPSVAGDNKMDYVPSAGFHHKPSMSWPPPNADEMAQLDEVMIEMDHGKQISAKALREQAMERVEKGKGKEPAEGFTPTSNTNGQSTSAHTQNKTTSRPSGRTNPQVEVDGNLVEVKDQIQFYTTNELLAHPLVSPVMQPTLGGLPPLCILVGGGEMLRDEQIYLAHKAADPLTYPPPSKEDYANGSFHYNVLSTRSDNNTAIARYPPTSVQIQIWDDLCHVAPTLSWTRPAKYMYRSVAQFGAWALARSQMSEIRILDDDSISLISTESSTSYDSDDPASSRSSSQPSRRSSKRRRKSTSKERSRSKEPGDVGIARRQNGLNRPETPQTVGRAGDPLPMFKNHMIRQRVTRHGDIYNLDAPGTLRSCTMRPVDVGYVKPTTVKKWIAVQNQITSRFGDEKRNYQAKRLQQMAETTGGRGMVFTRGREDSMLIGEERPPPTALAGRTTQHLAEMGVLKKPKGKLSKGLAMWSGWGSKHDEEAIEKEDEKVKRKEDVTVSVVNVRRRQSTLNLLGSGPIPGGGPLEAGEASTTAGEGPSAHAITAKGAIPVSQAQTAQGATPSATEDVPNPSSVAASGVATGAKLGAPSSPNSSQVPSPPPPPERTISQHPVVKEPNSPPATVPFKLARPADLQTAQASTLTLNDADGIILPDSATLPPSNYPHYSIASTLTPDEPTSPTDEPPLPSQPKHLSVPGAIAAGGAATDGRSATDVSPSPDPSRPSTADPAGSSRPISPGDESIHESIIEAQPVEAQAVTMTHARASSKGDIDLAAVNGNRASKASSQDEPDPSGAIIDDKSYLETDPFSKGKMLSTPATYTRASSQTIPPGAVEVHGAESRRGGEIKSAKEDSSNWAAGAMDAVEDARARTESRDGETGDQPERPGMDRFITADSVLP